jgi:hypothetical protein
MSVCLITFLFMHWGEPESLGTYATSGPTVPAQMIEGRIEHWWNNN